MKPDQEVSRLGPYQMLERIGAGGMGEVWKARDTRLNRTVAIKKPVARFSERFQLEAQAIAALNHPHICTLHDVGPDYLVMEYIDGKPLKGPLPLDQALPLAAQIADALDAAHRQRIVHRDLKPANILITKSGVKLLDFGLARREEEATASAETEETKAITGEGVVLGTPQYMAPEQIEGRPADARTDIFAFGCVLYEMLTGRRAFDGKSSASIVAAILAGAPPPARELQPSIPPALERILQICLAKDPEARWQSARDVRHALESVPLQDRLPAARPWSARLGWIAAGVCLLASAALAFLALRGREPRASAVRFGINIAEPGSNLLPLVSPGGEKIVLALRGAGGDRMLWMRTLASEELQPIPGTEGAGGFAIWSPDGRSLAFQLRGELKRVDLGGGPPRTLCPLPGSSFLGGGWNADGVIVFGGLSQPLHRVSAQGGEARAVTQLEPGERFQLCTTFLPDGQRFLYSAWLASGPELRVGSLNGRAPVRLPIRTGPVYYASGRLLYPADGAILAQPFDAAKTRLSGEPLYVTGPVRAFLGGYPGLFPFTASTGGVLVFNTGGGLTRLLWRDPSGKELGTLGPKAQYSNPALSPDGQRLAIDVLDERARTRDIWIFDLVRGSQTRLTNHPADDKNPVWSPDGRQIAFTSDRKGTNDLYVKPADGSLAEREILALPGWEHAECWSPGGEFLLYNQQRMNPSTQIFALPLSPGAEPKPLLIIGGQGNRQQAQLSPDGKYIAYSSDESAQREVFLQDFPPAGRRWQISSEGGSEPQWSRDGRRLYYIRRTRGAVLMAADIGAAGPGSARPRALFEIGPTPERRNSYVVAPDGRFLFVAPPPEQPAPLTVLVNWQAALAH